MRTHTHKSREGRIRALERDGQNFKQGCQDRPHLGKDMRKLRDKIMELIQESGTEQDAKSLADSEQKNDMI